MNIIVDAFGGDNAPLEIIKGSVDAKNEYGVDITLVGNEEVIKKVAKENEINIDGMKIVHADSVISQNEAGTEVVKKKKDSSMAVGLKMLHDGEGDAFVSAGNSGAICVGATLIVKRIKGIKRPGFAPVIPTLEGSMMLIDCGANVECKPQMLQQFAVMGSIYMEKVMGIKNPRVGLANVGTEPHKGGELQLKTYELLENSKLNFIGNIEGRDVPVGGCEVCVSDGFTGNLILKTYEGVAGALMDKIKGVFNKNLKTKLAAAMVYSDLKEMKKSIDYNEFGGAPIIGCAKPVFKAHGSANAKTFKNAIRLTKEYVENNVVEEISSALKEYSEGE
ncbi:MAG: phosphate acyltransferase PlsX [Ruminococcus sp.]|nr:phosphate acyltransferase PlsX [Ruminococcus sp.]